MAGSRVVEAMACMEALRGWLLLRILPLIFPSVACMSNLRKVSFVNIGPKKEIILLAFQLSFHNLQGGPLKGVA